MQLMERVMSKSAVVSAPLPAPAAEAARGEMREINEEVVAAVVARVEVGLADIASAAAITTQAAAAVDEAVEAALQARLAHDDRWAFAYKSVNNTE